MNNVLNAIKMNEIQHEVESDRRLKIKCIERTIDEESKKGVRSAIATATLFVATFVTAQVSGLDVQEAIDAEIKALSSWESLKEYFSMFTPATIASLTASVISFRSFLTHRRRRNEALQQYDDMVDIQKDNYAYASEQDKILSDYLNEQNERQKHFEEFERNFKTR